MAPRRVAQAGLIPVGFQTMSLANSTAVAINSTCKASSMLLVSVETKAARMRLDAVPTLTTGVLLNTTNSPYWIPYNGTSLLKFQRSTGTSKVSLMAYKYAGGDR